MPPREYTARIEDRVVHNDKFITVSFELIEPNTMEFKAGQYVSLKVDEAGTRRSYSIASSPEITHGFELAIDVTPGGKGSSFLTETPIGTEVTVLGPIGAFVIEDDPTEEAIVLVGTGSGVAPLRSMIFDLLQVQKDSRPVTFFWGIRYVESLFWQNEFQDLVERFPNFSFHPVISRAAEGWTLCRGRVTDCLSMHELPPNAGYYLCGGKPMIESVAQLLSEQGIAPEHVHHEKFF